LLVFSAGDAGGSLEAYAARCLVSRSNVSPHGSLELSAAGTATGQRTHTPHVLRRIMAARGTCQNSADVSLAVACHLLPCRRPRTEKEDSRFRMGCDLVHGTTADISGPIRSRRVSEAPPASYLCMSQLTRANEPTPIFSDLCTFAGHSEAGFKGCAYRNNLFSIL
jgi:hypothetical protein